MASAYIRFPNAFTNSTFSGTATFAVGSVSAPSIIFAGDTTTGFYSTAGAIRVAISGSNVFTINAGGIITAGATQSTYFTTTSGNTASSGFLRLANTEAIKWRNSGNSADIALQPGSSDSFISYGGVDLVTTSGTQTLTNKTLTAPVISTISNTGTLTLPTSTDTLVGRATTDTLSNKTLTSPTLTTATMTLTTSGGTPSTLNYYEEGSFSASFNAGAGAGGTNPTTTVNFTRVGKVVTLLFSSHNNMTAGATAAAFSTAASTVPSRLTPTNSLTFAAPITKNGSGQSSFGSMAVVSDGSLSIQVDAVGNGTWTSGNTNNGWYSFALSYTVQ